VVPEYCVVFKRCAASAGSYDNLGNMTLRLNIPSLSPSTLLSGWNRTSGLTNKAFSVRSMQIAT
jgi:hypothetical protein